MMTFIFEKTNNLQFFINIAVFLLLTWICLFNSDTFIFRKSMEKNCHVDGGLDKRNYRSLAKYKPDNSNDLYLKENFQNNEVNKKKDIYRNEKVEKGKSKLSNISLLNKSQYYTEVIDYNKAIFDGKHFHFEKKWINKKDYDNFLDKKRRICYINLKKIKFRSYRYGVALFLIFLMLGVGYIIGDIYGVVKNAGEYIRNALSSIITIPESLDPYTCTILYGIDIIIFSILIIIAIPKILKNKEIYNKIKLMNE
ncbi:fam-m protein [Plasmodium malariae]|uniref:Fam-m protein n=1 Tax=Plasmodium malariae TaxID=5858 RepID=A0A1D3JH34_PLAMA|nr:fam-m protein [Plasmodium malariae]SBT85619.1 fam-m protein [Plasmodium malariae]